MKIRLNKAHFPVNGLGPGQRIGLWFQGCSIRCEGCVSLDTWGVRPESTVDADQILAWCRLKLDEGASGITFSGGEPFEQSEGLFYLVEHLREYANRKRGQLDILCFTGLPFSAVKARHSGILTLLDAIVSEPFVKSMPTNRYLCGSENQVLHVLNENSRSLYHDDEYHNHLKGQMDISVSPESAYLAGIPRESDLCKLRDVMKARGVSLGKISWRE